MARGLDRLHSTSRLWEEPGLFGEPAAQHCVTIDGDRKDHNLRKRCNLKYKKNVPKRAGLDSGNGRSHGGRSRGLTAERSRDHRIYQEGLRSTFSKRDPERISCGSSLEPKTNPELANMHI